MSIKSYFSRTIAYLAIWLSFSFTSFAQDQTFNAELKELKTQYQRPNSIPFPAENKFSLSKATLGKTLFFDPRLSNTGTQSCASCHNPSFSWTDAMAFARGHKHKKLERKTLSILNLAWDHEDGSYMWDGRTESLEEQSLVPIISPNEMNMKITDLIEFLTNNTGYKKLFNNAFPEQKQPITIENITKSIATFERTVVSGLAPFDRWIMGDKHAISQAAVKGFIIFNGKANCAACHSTWRFSDSSFHDIGLNSPDIGRGAYIPVETMKHAFKTVGLRNIQQRAPYMHDGQLKTLSQVIDHYNHNFTTRESLSDEIKPLNLSTEEKKNLEIFLFSLTSQDDKIYLPIMPR